MSSKKTSESMLTEENAINEELELYLEKTIDSYLKLKDRIHKRTASFYLCILLSAATSINVLSTQEVTIPSVGLIVDVSIAGTLLLFVAGILALLRTLDLIGSLMYREKIVELHKIRFDTQVNIWSLSPASIVETINRFKHLGWYGQLLRIFIIWTFFMPLYIVIYKNSDMLFKFNNISMILFNIFIISFLISGFFEVFSKKIAKTIMNKI